LEDGDFRQSSSVLPSKNIGDADECREVGRSRAGLEYWMEWKNEVSPDQPSVPLRGAMVPFISDWLTVEESLRLLHAIFPNYPALYPCRPTPPREEWLIADNNIGPAILRHLV